MPAFTSRSSSASALDAGVARIRDVRGQVKKGVTQDQLDARMALLKPTLAYSEIAQADIVVEAVRGSGVGAGVPNADETMKPGAIPRRTPDARRRSHRGFTRRPQDVIGTHFFSPANVMKLLEVARRGDGQRRVRDDDEARQDTEETAVVSGVWVMVHRQPHDRAVLAPGTVHAR
jgi:3-hydroxyacyl-CoA dehydrogenase